MKQLLKKTAVKLALIVAGKEQRMIGELDFTSGKVTW